MLCYIPNKPHWKQVVFKIGHHTNHARCHARQYVFVSPYLCEKGKKWQRGDNWRRIVLITPKKSFYRLYPMRTMVTHVPYTDYLMLQHTRSLWCHKREIIFCHLYTPYSISQISSVTINVNCFSQIVFPNMR